MDSQRLTKWIQAIPSWAKVSISLISSGIALILLWRTNAYTAVTVTIVLGLSALFYLSLRVAFTKTPPLIEGGRGVYRYERGRPWAMMGIIAIPLIVVLLLFVEPTRTIVVMGFSGTPAASLTPTAEASVQPAKGAVLVVEKSQLPDGSTVYSSSISSQNMGYGSLRAQFPSILFMDQTKVVGLTIFPYSMESLPPADPASVDQMTPVGAAPINETPAPTLRSSDVISKDSVKIFPVMVAELAGAAFDISPDNPQPRAVTSGSPVKWSWTIRPKGEGEHSLILNLTIPTQVGGTVEQFNADVLILPVRVIARSGQYPSNALCIRSFKDENGDGLWQQGERPVAGAQFLVANSQGVQAGSYTSDATSEEYCFMNLPSDSYRLVVRPPQNLTTTSEENLSVTLEAGQVLSIDYDGSSGRIQVVPQPKVNGESSSIALLTGVLGLVVLLVVGVLGALIIVRRRT